MERIESLPAATVGPVEATVGYQASQLWAEWAKPGPAVVAERYPLAATLHVESAPDLLSKVILEPEVRGQFNPATDDLRVVDASDRQWPYLWFESEAADARIPVNVIPDRERGLYELDLGGRALTVGSVVLKSTERFLPHRVHLMAGKPGDRKSRHLAALW